jgi:hypothetical protein
MGTVGGQGVVFILLRGLRTRDINCVTMMLSEIEGLSKAIPRGSGWSEKNGRKIIRGDNQRNRNESIASFLPVDAMFGIR